MFVIGEISVHESVAETKFACDLEACKGACCTFPGGRGAPLQDDEVAEIEKVFPLIQSILPPEHRTAIARHGLVDGSSGNYATQCVEGKACVFVYYDNGIAKCSFEKAFLEKKIQWRKPLSCHLFPIRMARDARLPASQQVEPGGQGSEIHYEYFSECAPALERGRKEDIALHRFISEPLQRAFGKEFTEKLTEQIKRQQGNEKFSI